MISSLINRIPRPVLHQISQLFLRFAPYVFWGKRFVDPIDGRSYSYFFSYGYGAASFRKNALCPGTLSLERHRLMWLWLKRETDFFTKKQKMLHVAPELAFVKRFQELKQLELITADLESPWADVKMDLHDIPFPENSFDVVFCNHVLEHVEDDRRCMREIFRVLKPGGWALMQSPMNTQSETTFEDPTITDREERIRLFGQYDHVRVYGRDFQTRLEEAGFTVDKINYLEKLTPKEIKMFSVKGPDDDDAFFIGKKRE